MIVQETCLQVSHNDLPITGVCQNASCKQPSRKVCFQCVQELHHKDNNCQVTDIHRFDQLHDILLNFQQNTSQRNEKIMKICQINKLLLLKEIEEFMSYWKEQYKSWHYLEQISIQIVKSSNQLNIQNYLDNLNNHSNLKQFLNQFIQEGQDEMVQILSGKQSQSVQQKVKNLNHEPIDNIQENITKLTKQIEQNINMYEGQMFNFMLYEIRNNELAYSMSEKFIYYFDIHKKQFQFFKELSKFQQICKNKIFKLDDYTDKQICRKGFLLMKLEQFKEAVKYFDLIIEQFPENILAYKHKSQIIKYYSQNTKRLIKFKGAIECLDLCIKLNPNHGCAYVEKAKILEYIQALKLQGIVKLRESMECLDLCIKINPNYGDAYWYKAHLLQRQDNFKEAIECLDLCIKLNPNYGKAYKIKADILEDQRNFMGAIECLDLCIKLNPNYGGAQMKKAHLLYLQKNFKGFRECLDLCIKINPNYTDAYWQKANILEDQRNFMEAIECLDLFIKLNPNYEGAYRKKANILNQQKNFNEAIECLDLCIKLNPNYGGAYWHKADILEDQRNFMEAIECLNLCIKLHPNYEDIYFKKANILQGQNNFKEAIECLDLYIKLNPNHEDFILKKAYKQKEQILENFKNYKGETE